MTGQALLAIPAGNLDATYIGTRALITVGGRTCSGGISDVRFLQVGDELDIGAAPFPHPGCTIAVPQVPHIAIWLGGVIAIVKPDHPIMCDPSPPALAATDAPA